MSTLVPFYKLANIEHNSFHSIFLPSPFPSLPSHFFPPLPLPSLSPNDALPCSLLPILPSYGSLGDAQTQILIYSGNGRARDEERNGMEEVRSGRECRGIMVYWGY